MQLVQAIVLQILATCTVTVSVSISTLTGLSHLHNRLVESSNIEFVHPPPLIRKIRENASRAAIKTTNSDSAPIADENVHSPNSCAALKKGASPEISQPQVPQPQITQPQAPQPQTPQPQTPQPQTPQPQTPQPQTPQPQTPQPQVSNSEAPVDTKAMSGGKAMIDSVNAFRSERQLPTLRWSQQLVNNAELTGRATDGKAMRHKMGPGTYGQVLVMGFDDADSCTKKLIGYTPFELSYYSWLCEVPEDSALHGKCPDILRVSRIFSDGDRGHYDILTASRYKTIGCAFTRNPSAQKCSPFAGVWACDLGM